jgi:glutathione S-transferase
MIPDAMTVAIPIAAPLAMTDRPILYSFRRCPYAMRARMALAISGNAVELREVVLRDKPPEMLAVSPKGTVPILIMTDGNVMDESIDIMRWALGQNDPKGWLNGDNPVLIQTNDGPFKIALDRYKYPHRFDLATPEHDRSAGMAFLATLNAMLSDHAFLSGPKRGLADIAIFPFVRQFAATDQNWFDGQPVPDLQRWLRDMLAMPLFGAIMHRYPQWQAGDAPILFHQHKLFGH